MDDVSLDRRSELQKLYLNNMQEIKWRIEALDEIRFEKKTTRFFQTNIDFCVVQIRKILELIALSALVSDADIYKNKLGKIETMWNARLILQDIERIHPEFYPQPICQDSCDTNHWIDITDDYLTKDTSIFSATQRLGVIIAVILLDSKGICFPVTIQMHIRIRIMIQKVRGKLTQLLHTIIMQQIIR